MIRATIAFEDIFEVEPVKKFEIISTKIDPLVLSVAHYRNRLSDKSYIDKFFDTETYAIVNDSDYTTANSIRDYYEKKVIYWKLSDIELSSFRTCLEQFLTNEQNKFSFNTKNHGLIFRLPEFYDYDIALDSFLDKEYRPVEITKSHVKNATIRNVTFLKRINRQTRASNSFNYWFVDSDGILLEYKIDRKNNLLNVFHSIVTSEKKLKITADMVSHTRESYQFYSIHKLNSVFFDV